MTVRAEDLTLGALVEFARRSAKDGIAIELTIRPIESDDDDDKPAAGFVVGEVAAE